MNTADSPNSPAYRLHWAQRLTQVTMAVSLGVMAVAVFVNVVLRYGFGSGIAASEELSRLLFVWMVFLGAASAYPLGEHMAFTSLVGLLKQHPKQLQAASALIRLLVIAACVMLAWGAWQQVVVGMGSHSVVLGYPTYLLPLPAFLCSTAMALMASWELVRNVPLNLGHGAEVE